MTEVGALQTALVLIAVITAFLAIDTPERAEMPMQRVGCASVCALDCCGATPLVGRLVSNYRLLHSQLGRPPRACR